MLIAKILLGVAALNLLFLAFEVAINVLRFISADIGAADATGHVFKLADAGLPQMLGFLIYGGCTVGFIIYLFYLVRQ